MSTMTTATSTSQVLSEEAELLPAYLEHVNRLGLSARARRDRARIARDFLTDHSDLQAWMDQHVTTRMVQLRRSGAWPLLVGPWRGRKARPRPIGAAVAHATVLSVRNMLDDITAWDWADAPSRRLLFAADVPKLDRPLPRALAPDVDAALMTAVAALDDMFARIGLQVLRGTGLRVGELLDLEVDAVIDYGPAGTWLRVPLGKLATERSVPLDGDTLAVLDQWAARRGAHRPIPHPRSGTPTDFLFTEHGRRLGATRLRNGLATAAARAGLSGQNGRPMAITPHQLRHTYATNLANAGMSLQALMALLGHVTPEMTIRYARLASPTLRASYEQAIGTMRRRLTLTPVGRPIVPDKIAWLASEMLKSHTATAPATRARVRARTPTSARPARTSPPQPSSHPHWPTSSPTSTRSTPTPKCAAGPTRHDATSVSPTRSKVTSTGSNHTDQGHSGLPPPTRAG